MNHRELQAAIDCRDPQAIAEVLLAHGHTDNQQNAVLEVLFDNCTIGDVKRVRAWAEDWLVQPDHEPLRLAADLRWQAMVTVYAMSALLLKESGVQYREGVAT